MAKGVYIIGFENNRKNGSGNLFNFHLSNGTRSNQRDAGWSYYDHMMPAGCHNKIRSVTIHYYDHIRGFSFFDKEGALLWKIGFTFDCKEETVLLEENEMIIGVVAKLYQGYQSVYTDW